MAGVTATGFELKSLQEIVDEINLALLAAIGSGFDTSLDTPQGQIVNVIADAESTMWELLEGVYSSFDVRQAQGARLDQLGTFRNLFRVVGETDAAYRTRLLTPFNPTESAVGNLQAAVALVPGVVDVELFYNSTGVQSGTLQPLTISLVVTGGDDNVIAQAISDNLVFGLGLIGNTIINIDDGAQCRTIKFTRGLEVPIAIEVTTDQTLSIGLCAATSASTIKTLLLDAFAGTLSAPGTLINIEFVRAVLISQGIGVSALTLNGGTDSIVLTFEQVATLVENDITVVIL